MAKYKLTMKKRTKTCDIGISERGLVLYLLQTFGKGVFEDDHIKKNLEHCEDVIPLLKNLETSGYIKQVLK